MDGPVEHTLSFPPVGPQPNGLINMKAGYKSSLVLSLCYGSGFELSDYEILSNLTLTNCANHFSAMTRASGYGRLCTRHWGHSWEQNKDLYLAYRQQAVKIMSK